MAKKSYRRREKKTQPAEQSAERATEAQGGEEARPADGESPNKLMAWLWGVPIALVTLAVVLKVTGVS